jgi:selenide,water dikinase
VEDDELKYGLSVTGLVDPERIVRNSTARTGDLLILTKPLGTGIIATAVKGEMATDGQAAEAIHWMTTLNREAAELMIECRASAATDVTGFGLIGHALEMARGAGVTLRLPLSEIPLMGGLDGLAADGLVPAGCYRNRDAYAPFVGGMGATDDRLLPLYDPQTSGGLLIALAPANAELFLQRAEEWGIYARRIGEVLPPTTSPIEVTP